MTRRIALILVAALLGSCAPQPKELSPMPAAPAHFPTQTYRDLASSGKGQLYRLSPVQSQILIYTDVAGRLARFGHRHVIAARDVQGLVWLGSDFAASRMDLYFAVDALIIDEPAERAAAGSGFESVPSDKDIAGTRSNMLGEKLLDGARYPFVSAAASVASGNRSDPHLALTLTIKGQTFTTTVPVTLHTADGQLIADGELNLTQTALGLVPFTALGGAMAVADAVKIRYHLVAELSAAG